MNFLKVFCQTLSNTPHYHIDVIYSYIYTAAERSCVYISDISNCSILRADANLNAIKKEICNLTQSRTHTGYNNNIIIGRVLCVLYRLKALLQRA